MQVRLSAVCAFLGPDFMNCVQLFVCQAHLRPHAVALWHPDTGEMTYETLLDLTRRAQRALQELGVTAGTSVLIVEMPGPRLYALVLAALALGATVVAVEPWLPVRDIDRVIGIMRPTAFVASGIGQAWGARVPAVRAIPSWKSAARAVRTPLGGDLHVEDVDPDQLGLIAFTSGTTGRPKGVVRQQAYLVSMFEVYTQAMGLENETGADLCIFANFVLANLAAGRPSVVVPPAWRAKHLRRIDRLPDPLQPRTMSCGPAFLAHAMSCARLRRLEAVHVGGALSDAALFERAFRCWPGARFTHVYGSSEAEPVALVDAREAVRRSRDRGLFQVLCIGRPIDAIESRLAPDTVWITGPHVCRMYVGNEEENAKHKQRDDRGRVWHDMGDRIELRDGMWWYAGRSGQPMEDFHLEQAIYSALGSSRCFVHRAPAGTTYLAGEGLRRHADMLRDRFPPLDRLLHCRIRRDRRHRARIDRRASLAKGAPWLRG